MSARKTIPIERGIRIRNLRERIKLTRSQFEDLTGVSASTLKSFESGERELTSSKARLFSNLFSILYTKILGNDSPETNFDFILYGKKSEVPGLENINYFGNEYNDIKNEINVFLKNPLYMVLTVQDDLMSPFYKKEDVIAGKKVIAENQYPLYQGCVCIVETLKGGMILRKVIKVHKRKVTLCILNTHLGHQTDIFEDIEVRSIAQATRHWHLSEFVAI